MKSVKLIVLTFTASAFLMACGDDSSSVSAVPSMSEPISSSCDGPVAVDDSQEKGNQSFAESSSSVMQNPEMPLEQNFSSSSTTVANSVASSASEDFICDVQESATTVVITQYIKDVVSYKETGTLRGGKIYFHEEYEYADASMGAEECARMKEEYGSWREVACNGNSFTIDDYSDSDDIAEYAAEQREQCEKIRKMYESGELLAEGDN